VSTTAYINKSRATLVGGKGQGKVENMQWRYHSHPQCIRNATENPGWPQSGSPLVSLTPQQEMFPREDHEFEGSLVYKARLYLKKTKHNKSHSPKPAAFL
jgi:hypothetical protein